MAKGMLRSVANNRNRSEHIGSLKSILARIEKKSSSTKSRIIAALMDRGIAHRFDYRIGQYKAEILVSEHIVLEFETNIPPHEFKHAYFRRMGYKVIRVADMTSKTAVEATLQAIFQEIGGDR